MRFVLFYHSLLSDWNHAIAHFLRGVANELLSQGHAVRIFEPTDGWSLHNLREQGGDGVVKAFHAIYPRLRSSFYDPIALDLDEALADADVVIAHEWIDAGFLRRLGQHRAAHGAYKLLFHDAPHRPPSRAIDARARDLTQFDGVLAASEGLRGLYEDQHWARQVWTWREAVDTQLFRPQPADPARSMDLVWIGSWGDGERVSELDEFLLDPIRSLGLRARFYGARYPEDVLRTLRASRIDVAGWIPDFAIPAAWANGRFTVHVPRRMPGGLPHTPALRVLQALACGVPLVTAPWSQCAEWLTPGADLLLAQNGQEMARHLLLLQNDPQCARELAARGYQTVLSRHTCAHRVQELLAICHQLGATEFRESPDENPHIAPFPKRHARAERSHVPAAWN